MFEFAWALISQDFPASHEAYLMQNPEIRLRLADVFFKRVLLESPDDSATQAVVSILLDIKLLELEDE